MNRISMIYKSAWNVGGQSLIFTILMATHYKYNYNINIKIKPIPAPIWLHHLLLIILWGNPQTNIPHTPVSRIDNSVRLFFFKIFTAFICDYCLLLKFPVLLFWLFSSAIRSLGTVVYSGNYTEVRFASFLSGGLATMTVINPPKRKLAKRTFVH